MTESHDTNTTQDYLEHWRVLAHHTPLGVVCDLDGTLLPFVPDPRQSRIPPHLVDLLNRLAALPGVQPAVVSGRLRDQLDDILSPVRGVWLVAEHGGWRRRDDRAWEQAVALSGDGLSELADALDMIAVTARGALIERKTLSVAFHYRQVAEGLREGLHVEVDALLDEWLSRNPGFERLEGNHVIEVRPTQMRKSLAVSWLRAHLGPEARLLVLGDDLTDEDMFRELGVGDDPVLVGRPRRSRARWRLDDPTAVADFLAWVAGTRVEEATDKRMTLPEPLVTRSSRLAEGGRRYDLLVVSNRLPNVERTPGQTDEHDRKRNVGGLVAALGPAMEKYHGLWLGWSGQTTEQDETGDAELDEESSPALARLDFPANWYDSYYNGFSNRILWPLFHTFPRYVSFTDMDWECYRHVNQAFAEAAVKLVSPQTPVWLHDYHLLMAGHYLRQLGHRGPLGLFLHIPFPGPDLFGLLPWDEQLLDAMLDLDLIGFQTERDVDNFRHTIAGLSPARASGRAVEHRGRHTRVGAFPIGTTPELFQEPAGPEIAEEALALLRAIAPSRLILGVDRLDYTKGIPERLEAFEYLLAHYPQWRGRVALVQISVPSREDVPEYREQRQRIENIVGRVNGAYGEATWVPIRYLYRSYSPGQLAELYRAADVGYVTPLRDGMNLVAKEYVAAQDPAAPGVLVLSKFAGAAAELSDAILTNPWHPEGIARDLDRALQMDLAERQERHRRLLAVVTRNTAVSWAEDFLQALLGETRPTSE